MAKYLGKYQINSPRAKFWDYSGDGLYFITICTKEKQHFFGNIMDDVLIPSEMGLKAEFYWHQILFQFPDVELDYFSLMPNHLHGIIGIYKSPPSPGETRFIACPSPQDSNSTKPIGGLSGNKNPMGKKGLPEIIRWFKGRTTFEIRKSNPNFSWQSGYHDQIIQDSRRYEAICHYIFNNPQNWQNKNSPPP